MGISYVQETTKKFDYLDNFYIIIELLIGNMNQQLFIIQFKHRTFFFPSALVFFQCLHLDKESFFGGRQADTCF